MSNEPTQVLAAFAASLDPAKLPERVRVSAKVTLLDALACAVAGHEGDETAQVAAFAAALGQSKESTVIGADRMSLAGATVLNGYLVTAVTMCDTHRATLTHIMPEVLPAAFAIAERDDCSGNALLAAIIAGSEVATRIGLGLDYPVFRKKGFHGPGVLGPFGGAAAAGRLLGLDADTMARAFGLAGSQAAGTFAAWGTPTVKFHQCRGALSGLMAALLAREKFVATREFLTAPDGGLYNAYAEGGRPDLALGGLGMRWELEQLSLRPWPAATNIQGVVTATFDLIEQHRVSPADIKQVRLALSKVAHDMHGGFGTYKGKFEALLSAHYAVAAIVHDRALTLAQFAPGRYEDPGLRKFAAEQVVAAADPSLTSAQTRAQIELRNGQVLSTDCMHPRGTPENPMSAAQVADKFRAYASGRLQSTRIESIIEMVMGLEALPKARTLIDLLRAGAPG